MLARDLARSCEDDCTLVLLSFRRRPLASHGQRVAVSGDNTPILIDESALLRTRSHDRVLVDPLE